MTQFSFRTVVRLGSGKKRIRKALSLGKPLEMLVVAISFRFGGSLPARVILSSVEKDRRQLHSPPGCCLLC